MRVANAGTAASTAAFGNVILSLSFIRCENEDRMIPGGIRIMFPNAEIMWSRISKRQPRIVLFNIIISIYNSDVLNKKRSVSFRAREGKKEKNNAVCCFSKKISI